MRSSGTTSIFGSLLTPAGWPASMGSKRSACPIAVGTWSAESKLTPRNAMLRAPGISVSGPLAGGLTPTGTIMPASSGPSKCRVISSSPRVMSRSIAESVSGARWKFVRCSS